MERATARDFGVSKNLILGQARCVGMQACGDVMIGQHGRSVHEAIPHICGAKAIPTSLLVLSSPRNN